MTDPSPVPATSDGRTIDLSVQVPGTPEEVWKAIATGAGVTSWFIPFAIEGREGGRVEMDFGSFGKEEATVAAWEPPHRFVYSGGQGGKALAYEWLVEARDGGTCVVRLVNSGFGYGEDWDGEYDGMSEGWLIFLESLRLHLTHHRGQQAHAAVSTVMLAGPNQAGWATLCRALGLPTDVAEGAAFRTGDPAPLLSGRVEVVLTTGAATTCLVIVDEPAPGTGFISVEGDGDQVAASVYLYLYGPDATAGDQWATWLTERFPPMTEILGAESSPTQPATD